ncbi:phage head-tail adaptor, putative, SPP1 family [Faunimonas pinastri]|uniref:Phage head-tail adaptor, putative, SPP1 family n=1 Tax=Faunimonas pinastri TaxID=1855383 RepID=A0A1H9F6T4_9HYPH|nr:phage head closure protein [Faunimonas pinastri]SEQ33143.1 phage head-tail adaptor, putative, SPP1 family [Faunimonas pinastri]
MPITSGQLRERVRLERRTPQKDGFGNSVSAWQAQFERRAAVQMMRGGEEVLASRLEGVQPATIVLRFDEKTRAITADWRAIHLRDDGSEREFAIQTAEDMEGRRQWITLTCKAGVAS